MPLSMLRENGIKRDMVLRRDHKVSIVINVLLAWLLPVVLLPVGCGDGGGDGGGGILFEGLPEDLIKVKESFTGRFLKEELK